MNEVTIFKDKGELLNALAESICLVANKAIKEREQFNFVLSGGSSPKNLYELLASEKFRNKIDWTKTYFFFGDERFVSKNDPQRIKAHFGEKLIAFDFILLGLGDNAHTASLFPNTSVLNETEATIKDVFVKEVDMFRITMTAPLINQALNIAFLVFGNDKAEAVFHVLKDAAGTIEQYPAKLIRQENNKIHWYLDQAAAHYKE